MKKIFTFNLLHFFASISFHKNFAHAADLCEKNKRMNEVDSYRACGVFCVFEKKKKTR